MSQDCMKIGIALVCLTAFAHAQGAKVGGEARQAALGGSNIRTTVIINPFVTEDPALLLVNPAYQARYANYAWANLGGGALVNAATVDNGYGNQNVGVSFGLTRELVLGAVLSYDPSGINTVSQLLKGGALPLPLPAAFPGYIPAGLARGTVDAGPITGAQTIPPVANMWEILGAYHAGALEIGFGFTYGRSNSDATASAATTSASREAFSSVVGFRGGVLLDLGAGSLLSAYGALRFDKATDNVKVIPAGPSSGGEYSVSGTEAELGARLRLRMSNRFGLVPYAEFLSTSGEPKEDAAPRDAAGNAAPRTDSEKLSVLGLALGIGGEYRLPSVYVVGGLSFQMFRGKSELSNSKPQSSSTQTVTYTTIPTVNFGAEWWLTDWLAARAGYFRMLGSTKLKSESTPGATGESNLTEPYSGILLDGLRSYTYDGVVTLGLGGRVGNFSIDATVSDEALRRGLGLLGSGDNINAFGYITASFNFE